MNKHKLIEITLTHNHAETIEQNDEHKHICWSSLSSPSTILIYNQFIKTGIVMATLLSQLTTQILHLRLNFRGETGEG